MINALWTSASGLMSHQLVVDTIGNNIANVNTNAFKRNVAQFQDLLYQKGSSLGEFEPDSSVSSTSSRTETSFGTGVRNSTTNKLFTQGRLEPTGSELDLAIQGEGFFKVMLPNGTAAYTRDGSFRLDASRQIVTPQGYKLEPSLQIPEGAKDMAIEKDGTVKARKEGENDLSEIGKIVLFNAVNPAGMSAVGENLYAPTVATGVVSEVELDADSTVSIEQGFLEGSNIELADEMTQLVIAQRSYQMNASAFKNADEMLSIAANIRG
jgi:flagellar basal-body rod protein FlgG